MNYKKLIKSIDINKNTYTYISLKEYEKSSGISLSSLPFTKKILIENILRNMDKDAEHLIEGIIDEGDGQGSIYEIPFNPSRVILQDFTGVPSMVDLAALRTACINAGIDPQLINPGIPCDLIIDHSIQVDYFGTGTALKKNMKLEMERNIERYKFLKWSESAFSNLRIFPPGSGIVHQINLEYIAKCITSRDGLLFPDTLVGTDSHTTMINAMGIVGWGVGGIEAEAVMLNQPVYILPPPVVGFKLTGESPGGVTATDIVLTITQILRKKGVVGKFVEFFGDGLDNLTLPDRAVISNMAPEYGATIGFFPVDDQLISYLEVTGRDSHQIDIVRSYSIEQELWRSEQNHPEFSDIIHLDLSTVEPSVAGPLRPQDRIPLSDLKSIWEQELSSTFNRSGKDTILEDILSDGSVVIAAITSCTNTSNPELLITAGLLAKNAVEMGLNIKPWVKTSFAPGSRAVEIYLKSCGLLSYFEQLGFHIVGYGCTTCIGNSGPIPEKTSKMIKSNDLVVASVLSGNRNFEGRINPETKANFLASPPLVIVFAITGRIDIDLLNEPIGTGKDNKKIFLKDIWPSREDVSMTSGNTVDPEQFNIAYSHLNSVNEEWNKIDSGGEKVYKWDAESTYIRIPYFLENIKTPPEKISDIIGARVLVKAGDFITTDHISPAGFIPEGPAAEYLSGKSVIRNDFNSFGARRGNPEVMVRGTFANIRLRNEMAPGTSGGWTTYLPENEEMYIWDASCRYSKDNIPLLVIAGKGYGMGSSRDWAAKGTFMLGIKAVIAESFERIHRSNLIGMGVLPLEFLPGQDRNSLNISGTETFNISLSNIKDPGAKITIDVVDPGGGINLSFYVRSRIDTVVEYEYFLNGGILQTVFNKLQSEQKS